MYGRHTQIPFGRDPGTSAVGLGCLIGVADAEEGGPQSHDRHFEAGAAESTAFHRSLARVAAGCEGSKV